MVAKFRVFFDQLDHFVAKICGVFGWLNGHLYKTKTSALQIISGLCLIFFGLAFGLNGSQLYALNTYHHFNAVHPLLVALVLVLVGSCQFGLALFVTARSNILSGWMLHLNGVCWLAMCSAYVAGYPPLNPAVLVTLLIGLVCITTGRGLIAKNKQGR